MRATSVALATGRVAGAPATLRAVCSDTSAASSASSAVAGQASAFRDGGCAGGTGGAAGADAVAAEDLPVKMGEGPDPRSGVMSTGSGDHAPGRTSAMRLRNDDAALAADVVALATAALALATVGVPDAAAAGEASAAAGVAGVAAAAAITVAPARFPFPLRASKSRVASSFLAPFVSRLRSSSAAFSAATFIPPTSSAVRYAIDWASVAASRPVEKGVLLALLLMTSGKTGEGLKERVD